jgi:hypothetical protein
LDPFGLFGAYALKKQAKSMAGIYNNVDPNIIRLLIDTGLINFDPLAVGVDIYDVGAVHLGDEGEERHSPPDDITVETDEVELRDVTKRAGDSSSSSADLN